MILSSGLKVKRFPNCGSAHRAMDALLELRERPGFAADAIGEIRVHAPATHLANLMYERPETVAQAKFSLEFALATIALRGRCSLAEFDPATVSDPAVRAFYPRIRRFAVDKGEGEFPTRVEVEFKDGTVASTEVAWPAGSLAAPFTEAQMWTKFNECAAGLVAEGELARLHDLLGRMEQLESIAPIMDLLVRPGSAR